MAGIARANIDWASTHINGDTHSAGARTLYVPGFASNVYVNGQPAIVQGDRTACGEITIGASSSVFINEKGVHRLGDKLDSHAGTYSPSVCASASTDVFVG